MIQDEKRGFVSYDALWMRLQTGLVQKKFNPLADMIDADAQGERILIFSTAEKYAKNYPAPLFFINNK